MRHERIEIAWLDSMSSSPWVSKDEAVKHNALDTHRTIGFFIAEDEKAITVASSVSEQENGTMYADLMTIPKAVVQSIHKIRLSGQR